MLFEYSKIYKLLSIYLLNITTDRSVFTSTLHFIPWLAISIKCNYTSRSLYCTPLAAHRSLREESSTNHVQISISVMSFSITLIDIRT